MIKQVKNPEQYKIDIDYRYQNDSIAYFITWENEYNLYTYQSGFLFDNTEQAHDAALEEIARKNIHNK